MAKKSYSSWPTIPQVDPWGGLDSMMSVLNDMEYRRDKSKEAKTRQLMGFMVEQQKMQDARTEKNVSALETDWRQSKSPAQRGLLQAKAKNLVGRNPRLRNRVSNITGGILDLNLEAAENYQRYNKVPPIDPAITWESDFVAKSRHEFKKRHLDDRARWIAGGKQGKLNLTKMIEYGTTEGEGSDRIREFATFDDSGAISLYGSTNKNDMFIQSEGKKYGMTGKEYLETVGGDGTSTVDMGTMQVRGRILKRKKKTVIIGKNRGASAIIVEGLPQDLRRDEDLTTRVMNLHGDQTSKEDLDKKDWPAKTYLEHLQNYYKFKDSKQPDKQVKKLRATEYMTQALPNKTAVFINPGHEEAGMEELFNFQGGWEGDWVTGETEYLRWVAGSRVAIEDKAGNRHGFIWDDRTDGIKDKNGNEVKLEATDKNGNIVSHAFKTGTEVKNWLEQIDYKAMKEGKTKVSFPGGTMWQAGKGRAGITDAGIEPIAMVGDYQVGQSGPDSFFIRKAGEGWRLPATRDEMQMIRIYSKEGLRQFKTLPRAKGYLKGLQ